MAKAVTEIRNMFVSLVPAGGGCQAYDVAILSPGDGYVEYEISVRHNRMTNTAYDTIMSMLAGYRFTAESEVCMTDNVPARNPISMYVKALAQQVGFRVCRVAEDKITGRLRSLAGRGAAKPAGDAPPGSRVDAVWRRLVGSGTCGWITPAYDAYLKTLGPHRRRRKKLVRVGAYYMRRRRLKYQYTKRSRARAAGLA